MNKKLTIGLFGFGCVGQGLYHVLNNSTGFKANITRIAVKDKTKERNVDRRLLTYDKWDILNDPEIDVVVELINDADEAFQIVSEALKKGKHVVTANKKLLALHLEELYALQLRHGVSLLYEGAVCASIPVLRTLEEYFDNEALQRISGIFNGTTNYILTKTIKEKQTYELALRAAQEKGFAESDPTNDVEGYDSKYKAVILALHAFGAILPPEKILNLGITVLQEQDIYYANEKNYRIKLTPVIQRISSDKICAFVLPQFIKEQDHLFYVDDEYNGVIVEGLFSGEQFLQGKGAGSYPTGAAVLSDISALSHGYRYEYKKRVQGSAPELTSNVLLNVYLRYNSPRDLEKITFEDVKEKYTASGYNYIIGTVNLNTIIAQKEYLLENRLFLALADTELKAVHDKEPAGANSLHN